MFFFSFNRGSSFWFHPRNKVDVKRSECNLNAISLALRLCALKLSSLTDTLNNTFIILATIKNTIMLDNLTTLPVAGNRKLQDRRPPLPSVVQDEQVTGQIKISFVLQTDPYSEKDATQKILEE